MAFKLDTPEVIAQKKAKAEAEKAAVFQVFLAKREIKLLMSLVPPTEPPETLESLMRLAFDAGADHGAGDVAKLFMDAIFKDKPNPSAL